ADYPKIKALMERHAMDAREYHDWQRLWWGNPVWPRVPHWPIGWVLENADDVVGFFGSFPSLFTLRGRDLIASVACDWVIDKPYRAHKQMLVDAYFGQALPH